MSLTRLTRNRRWFVYVCYAVAAAYGVSAALVVLIGGYTLPIGPLQLASHKLFRDVVVALVAGGIGTQVGGVLHFENVAPAFVGLVERIAVWVVAAVAVGVFVVGTVWGTHCACGADAYGYVSEASLWARGSLHVQEPLMPLLPSPSPEWSLSPLGYKPATYFGAIVPSYAPGLPMAMALSLVTLRAPISVFLVVPLLGSLAVWCSFLLGRRLDSAATGLWCAALVASSPTFLYQLIQPMSDVPVTGWWLAAIVLLFGDTALSAALAGFAASAAVLTRPNLVPLLGVFALYFAWQQPWRRPAVARRGLCFFAAALVGPIVVALEQNSLYGSPLMSGYGRAQDIYVLKNFWPNVYRYSSWLWESHGPLIFVGLLSPLSFPFLFRYWPRQVKDILSVSTLFIGLMILSYIFYIPFDNWSFTRFLLPAIPLLCLLAVWTLTYAVRRLNLVPANAILMLVFAAFAVHWFNGTVNRGVLTAYKGERRYLEAARFVASTTPGDEWMFAMQHGGSLRYYAGRETIRYDNLDPQWLDRLIRFSRDGGHGPLLVLDDWEEEQFRQRFRGQEWGALDWPPKAEFDTQPRVRIYDPFDRDRFRSTGTGRTRRIHVE